MKKTMLGIAGGGALLVLIAAAAWFYIGRTGATRLETWIGQHLTSVLEAYITPQISFASLDYQAPRTVVIADLQLRSNGRTLLAIRRMLLELAEVPRHGVPIQIERIVLDRPNLHFEPGPSGGFNGWSEFVRPDVARRPESVPQGRRFSDVLHLRHAEVKDGEVVYQDATGATMRLPGLNFELNTEPAADGPGWYSLAASLARAPLLEASLQGRLNVDDAQLQIDDLRLTASLGPQQYETVPPELQSLLRAHDVRGALQLSAQGLLPLAKPQRFTGDMRAEIAGAHFRSGADTVPVERIEVAAELPDGGATLQIVNAVWLFGGRPLLDLPRVTLDVAGIPEPGSPLHIRRVRFESPHVALVSRPAGGLAGWSRGAPESGDRPGAAPGPATRAATSAPSAEMLTDLVIVEHVEIGDAVLEYDFGDPAGPLLLAGVNADVEFDAAGTPGGALAFSGNVAREPLISADFTGRLDLPASVLELENLQAEAALGAENYAEWPEQAQRLLKKYAPHGHLTVRAAGRLPLSDPSQSAGRAQLELRQAGLTLREASVLAEYAHISAELPDRGVTGQLSGIEVWAGEVELISAENVSLSLPALPRAGDPLHIAQLIVAEPQLSLLRTASGDWAGWTALARSNRSGDDSLQGTPRPNRAPATAPAFRIDEFAVTGGAIRFQPAPAMPPVVLGGLHLTVQSEPAGPGGYALRGELLREPLLRSTFTGRLDVPAELLQIDTLELAVSLVPESLAALPEPLAQSLRAYGLEGDLQARLKARIPISSPERSEASGEVHARAARCVFRGITLSVDRADLRLAIPRGPLELATTGLAFGHENRDFLTAQSLSLELSNLPWTGDPLRVSRVTIHQPRIELVRRNGGGLAGWSEILRDDSSAATSRPVRTSAALPPFVIEQLDVNSGEVTFSPGGEAEPLTLSDLDLQLQVSQPESDGWQPIRARLDQSTILHMQVEGRLDPEQATLVMDPLTIDLSLQPEQYESLPARMRALLDRHQVRGSLTMVCHGTMPIRSPMDMTGQVEVQLQDGQFAVGGLRWPVERLDLQAEIPLGPLRARAGGLAAWFADEELLSVEQTVLDLPRQQPETGVLRLDRLSVTSPRLVLARNAEGDLVGWSGLFSEAKDAGAPVSTTEAAPQSEAGNLVLGELDIDNGQLVYRDGPEAPVMELPGIDVSLRMPPEEGRDGWYALRGEIRRPPQLQLHVDGRLNVPQAQLELDALRLALELREEQYATLPPQLQELLHRREIQGRLQLQARGRIPLRDLSAANGTAQVSVQDAHFTLGRTAWPVAELSLDATLENRKATAKLDSGMLGGRVNATADLHWNPQPVLNLQWMLDGLRIERALRAAQSKSRLSGSLSSAGELSTGLTDFPKSLGGAGRVEVRDGHLMNLPVLESLLQAIRKVPLPVRIEPHDRAEAAFVLRNDRANLTAAEVVSTLAAMRGSGDIYFNGRLDLEVQAGVFEKLRGELGAIGDWLGRVRDDLVSYTVTGTLSDPKVGVRAGGLDIGF